MNQFINRLEMFKQKTLTASVRAICTMVEMTGLEPASKRESLARTTVYPMIG